MILLYRCTGTPSSKVISHSTLWAVQHTTTIRKSDACVLCKRAARAAYVHFPHSKRLQLSSSADHRARLVTSRAMGLYSAYTDLLTYSELPTLQTRRLFFKLSYLYQVINGSFIFPNAPLTQRHIRPLRNSDSYLLERPATHTNAYMYSFFPHVISLWNNLPSSLHNCPSLLSFKHSNHFSFFILGTYTLAYVLLLYPCYMQNTTLLSHQTVAQIL